MDHARGLDDKGECLRQLTGMTQHSPCMVHSRCRKCYMDCCRATVINRLSRPGQGVWEELVGDDDKPWSKPYILSISWRCNFFFHNSFLGI